MSQISTSAGGDEKVHDDQLPSSDIQILEEVVDLSNQPATGTDPLLEESVGGVTLAHPVHLIFVRLYQTILIWAGNTGHASLDNVALAIGSLMTTMTSDGQAKGSGGSSLVSADDSAQLASRLSLKLNEGRPVYVALNYSPLATSSGGQLKLALDKAIFAFARKCITQDPQSK